MKKITCNEYDILKASGEPFIMLDVRDQVEFANGHMPDAINIPLHVLPLKCSELLPDKSATIITCCMRGGRAGQAATFLIEQGYANAMVLEGGYYGYCGI